MSNHRIEAEWILYLLPGAKFSLTGNVYEGLVWHDDRPKPTEQEILDAGAEYEESKHRRHMRAENWRIEQILEDDGLLSQVESLIDQSPNKIKRAWGNAPYIRRLSQSVLAIQNQLGWSDEQVDDIFERAQNLEI